MEDKFKLYKKWFWVGVAVGFLNLVAGLIYAAALMTAPEHRKEGIIILIWTLAVFTILALTLGPALQAR